MHPFQRKKQVLAGALKKFCGISDPSQQDVAALCSFMQAYASNDPFRVVRALEFLTDRGRKRKNQPIEQTIEEVRLLMKHWRHA